MSLRVVSESPSPFCPRHPKSRSFVAYMADCRSSTAPDPLVMAPFLPGDFITFTGFRQGNEVVATSIVAQNVEILTLGDLVYVRMELGLLGIDNPNPNAEFAESRVSFHTGNLDLISKSWVGVVFSQKNMF